MDSLTMGMVVLSLLGLAAGFAMSLHSALAQSDRVIIKIDGEIFQVRKRHSKEDIQRVLSRLIPPHTRHRSAAAGQTRQVRH